MRGDQILRDMFRNRSDWFRHVFYALANDRRSHPRQPCLSETYVTIKLPGRTLEAKVKNSSCNSIAVELSNAELAKGALVSILPRLQARSPEAVHMIRGLRELGDDFSVTRIGDGLVALRREAKASQDHAAEAVTGLS